MLVYSALCFVLFLYVVKSTMIKQASGVDSFKQCLMTTPISLGHCLGMGALTKLQTIDNNPEFDLIDGVTFSRDEQQVREAYNFQDRDPGNLRTIVDSLEQVFSRRSLRWDMSYLYPGLLMRVAPSTSAAGVLEFVMDPHREALSQHTLKEVSTGRLMARQFLLPFLLGFKFNVATLIPIIFGILALIAKKTLFISKIGLILSSAIGLGSLLFGNKYPPAGAGGAFNPGFGGTGGHYGPGGYNRYPDEENYYGGESLFRGSEYIDENNVKFFNDVQQPFAREDKTSARNFAWNDAEKKTKT